jgi:hypothetical protein
MADKENREAFRDLVRAIGDEAGLKQQTVLRLNDLIEALIFEDDLDAAIAAHDADPAAHP